MQLRRFLLTSLTVALLFLVMFGVFAKLGLEAALARSLQAESMTGVLTAGIGVLLLIADVFLPVPSSLVMIAFGRAFGVVIGGALSVFGTVGATAFGMLFGRLGQSAFRRLISEAEYQRAAQLLDSYGLLAVLASRPVPILAETVALVAGATGMSLGRGLLAATLGSLPAALLYAWAGSRDLNAPSGVVAFSGVLLLAGVTFLVGRRSRRTAA
jgi:uncharacterized membrane protein YdjX (TVP38/TMEM64 family)